MNSEAKHYFPWFAVQVRSNHEQSVAAGFGGLNLESYCPVYQTSRHGLRHVKQISLPLFPGYVFGRFDPLERLPVLKLSGVVRIVGFGADPVPIEESEMAAVRQIADSGLPRHACRVPGLGDPVEVLSGPLSGLEGILLEENRRSRFVVTLTLLNRSVSVEMDRDWIVARRPAAARSRQASVGALAISARPGCVS